MFDYFDSAKGFCKALEGKDCKKIAKLLDNGYKGMYVILRILNNSKNTISAGDLTNKMGITTARVAVAIKTLVNKGLIVRSRSKEDGRKAVIEITAKGRETIEKREKEVLNIIVELMRKLSPEEVKTYVMLSQKLLG